MINTSKKILSWEEAKTKVEAWQSEKQQIVFTNGCFDIVHLGHIDYLEKARNKGDRMVLGLNTDASVKRLKGEKRPIIEEYPRARLLATMEFIDAIVFFEEDTPLKLIEHIKPDILTKGSDYTVDNIVGADFVIKNGGRVETLDLVEGYSTSNIIKKIAENY